MPDYLKTEEMLRDRAGCLYIVKTLSLTYPPTYLYEGKGLVQEMVLGDMGVLCYWVFDLMLWYDMLCIAGYANAMPMLCDAMPMPRHALLPKQAANNARLRKHRTPVCNPRRQSTKSKMRMRARIQAKSAGRGCRIRDARMMLVMPAPLYAL